jgi:hypothetical protein
MGFGVDGALADPAKSRGAFLGGGDLMLHHPHEVKFFRLGEIVDGAVSALHELECFERFQKRVGPQGLLVATILLN